MTTIKSMIDDTCSRYGGKTAFTIKEKNGEKTDISYNQLLSDITRLSKGLLGLSLNKKAVIVTGKNSYYWALSALSVFYSGAILVPVDSNLPESEFTRIAQRSGASAIIYSDEVLSKADVTGVHIKISMQKLSDYMSDEPTQFSERSGDDMGLLMFTSGTTSTSKAVMLSDKNILSNIEAMKKWEDFRESDVNLALLPYYHAFGLTALLLFLNCGIRSVYAEGLRIKKALTEYGVTLFVGVPLILDRMKKTALSVIEKNGKKKIFSFAVTLSRILLKLHIDLRGILFSEVRKNIGALRLVISGAAPLSESTIKFFDDIGILLVQGYGLTEASPVISAENEDNRRIGSVGKALPGIDVIIDSSNEEGIGEILAKGKNIMLGYFDEENQPFKDGYLKTGDLGYIDKDGFIFIRGRSKNVLVLKNGKNVYPEEIESLIAEINGVTESIVYLSDDSKNIHATIVYDPEITTPCDVQSEIEKINLNLSEYKQIKKAEITSDPLSKTSTGKIKRNLINK